MRVSSTKVNKLKSIHVHVYTYTSVGSDLDQYVLPLQHDSYHVFLYMRIDFLAYLIKVSSFLAISHDADLTIDTIYTNRSFERNTCLFTTQFICNTFPFPAVKSNGTVKYVQKHDFQLYLSVYDLC